MSDLGNKQIMANNIKKYMDINNKTRNDVCSDLKIAYTTFSDWVNAKKYPRIDKIEMLANYFGIEKSDLVENKKHDESSYSIGIDIGTSSIGWDLLDNLYYIDKKKFPLLGEVACGEPIYVDEDRESYIMAGTDIKADFCLKCKGDSMINARIQDGDIVFIRKQDIVNNGEIAAIIIDHEATLKRFYYYKDQNMVILKPENPKYQDIILTGEQLDNVRVLGKAIAFQSDVI